MTILDKKTNIKSPSGQFSNKKKKFTCLNIYSFTYKADILPLYFYRALL